MALNPFLILVKLNINEAYGGADLKTAMWLKKK